MLNALDFVPKIKGNASPRVCIFKISRRIRAKGTPEWAFGPSTRLSLLEFRLLKTLATSLQRALLVSYNR